MLRDYIDSYAAAHYTSEIFKIAYSGLANPPSLLLHSLLPPLEHTVCCCI